MGRPILHSALVLLLLALVAIAFAESSAPADDEYSLAELQQQMWERIRAANVSLPVGGGSGAKSLQSYRVIDPYILSDLITAIAMLYSAVIYNYPEFLQYDVMDLRLMLAQYAPQRIEFNYVNRV